MKVIAIDDINLQPEDFRPDNKNARTQNNDMQSLSVALMSPDSFVGWYRYPPEDRYWLQMINDTAYFRDVFAGGMTYLYAETNGESWNATAARPDGSTLFWYSVRFYDKYLYGGIYYDNCFVSYSPRWLSCGGKSIYVTWFSKSQCMQTGDWTMNFYNDGAAFYSGKYALLPEINPEKASKPWVTLLNQGFYGANYDSICKGPIDPKTGEITSVPCDETYSIPWKISQKGCYLTSTAMILSYHGANTDPDELNTWLINYKKKNGKPLGYDITGGVNPYAVARFATMVKGKEVSYISPDKNDAIEKLICAYGPQMTGVKIRPNGTPKHWVTPTGMNKEKTTFKINDPSGGETTTIQAKYGNQYAQLRAFSGPEYVSPYKDESGIRIVFYSPVEPVLTDPQGRRLGYDPVKKVTYDEIPRGWYNKYHIEDAESGAPGPEMKEIDIGQPLEGDYKLEVTGTDTGTYGVDIQAYDIEQSYSDSMEFEKIPIIPGQKYSYGFYFAKAVGSKLEVFGAYDGGGQRPKDVNKFLSYINPSKSQTELSSWPIAFNLMISYDKNIIPSTFTAELNGVDISSMFKPMPGVLETVNINLNHGRNVLLLSVEGNLPTRVATDTDRLVFLAP